MKPLIVLCFVFGLVLGVEEQSKNEAVKQRKPTLPTITVVGEGSYPNYQQTPDVVISQYELRERHRTGRQLAGLRSGGGYLNNKPVYTPNDHLAARPALPLSEIESHPLSNFPAHYSGDLEEPTKELKKEEKKPEQVVASAGDHTVKKDSKAKDSKQKSESQLKRVETVKQPELATKSSSAISAKPLVNSSTLTTEATTVKTAATEAVSPKKKEEQATITQQETVSGKPPVAVD